jgi:hypothetical protein
VFKCRRFGERLRYPRGCGTLLTVATVLRPRWSVALLGTLLGPLYAMPGFVRTHDWMALVFGIALGCLIGPRWIRARSLTLTDQSLKHCKGYTYRLTADWADVIGVERRGPWVLKFDELRLRAPAPEPALGRDAEADSQGEPKPISDRFILLALYDRHWRTGSIGAALRAHNIPFDVAASPRPKVLR